MGGLMQLVNYAFSEPENKQFRFYYFDEEERKYDNFKIITLDCKDSEPVVNEFLNETFNIELEEQTKLIQKYIIKSKLAEFFYNISEKYKDKKRL
jgi:hypothetical protein